MSRRAVTQTLGKCGRRGRVRPALSRRPRAAAAWAAGARHARAPRLLGPRAPGPAPAAPAATRTAAPP